MVGCSVVCSSPCRKWSNAQQNGFWLPHSDHIHGWYPFPDQTRRNTWTRQYFAYLTLGLVYPGVKWIKILRKIILTGGKQWSKLQSKILHIGSPSDEYARPVTVWYTAQSMFAFSALNEVLSFYLYLNMYFVFDTQPNQCLPFLLLMNGSVWLQPATGTSS